MFIWNPLKLKELKQRGLKIKYYNYDIRMRDKTIEELESERASKRASEQAGGRVGPELSSAQPEVEKK
mgnify:CR=1 FL=1|jgi:hypothetical protein|tara:strand:- start:91 stop:294 length:204 start_codon:yes stop_codon:yes gene_type:complete